MTNKKELLIVMALFTLTILACNAIQPQTEPTSAPTQPVVSTLELPQEQINIPQTEAEVPRVTPEEAKAALDSGEAVIVDVRGAENYAEAHIAGAISIQLGEFESNIANVPLDKNQWIITYCT